MTRTSKLNAAIVAAMLAATPALAAQTAQNSTAPATAQPAQISSAKVEKVGKALHEVAMLRNQYTPKLKQDKTNAQKQADMTKLKQAEIHAVTKRGLTVREYSDVIRAAQNDPKLRAKLLKVAELKTK